MIATILKPIRSPSIFAENPKDNPLVVTISLLHGFFSQLLHLHGLHDKSPRAVSSALRINPFFVNEYISASRNYPMKKVSAVISLLHEYDVKSKGVGTKNLAQHELLKELLVRIMC